MNICCEIPKDLYDVNEELNDYDLVLFHLYCEYDWYKEYYLNLRQTNPDRIMIFDNSAYEFYIKGEKLDLDKYFNAINELNPNYYILPDSLMNRDETLKNAFDFFNKYNNLILKSQPIGVIQGRSTSELLNCYNKFIFKGISNIAIPFHLDLFKNSIPLADTYQRFLNKFGKLNEDHYYAMGRIDWIRQYIHLFKNCQYIHLLGSHNPYEVDFYHNFNISSIDTGYPVKCAMEGYELFNEPNKPNIIIDEFLTDPLKDEQKSLIVSNINSFKKLCLKH